MNNITFKEYQKKAVDNIYEKADHFLKSSDENSLKRIIFRSPTGSGKTVMMAGIVERLALESDNNLSFVWISKGVLADQSRQKFESLVGGGGIEMSALEDILDNEIKENEVLFINWEKIFSKAGKDDPDKDIKKGDPLNKFMRGNEWDRTLKVFCENARAEGRKIVLIIDESHLNITPNTIAIIDEIIKPTLQIDVTATPKLQVHYDYGDREGEYIELQTVKDAEVIKKEVIINVDIDRDELKSEKSGDVLIFERAIKKREELEKLYKKEGSKIRPLVLIQLPNEGEKLSALDKQKIEWAEEFLKGKGITYENKRLAKWLTGKDKENLDNITDPDNNVEFLIFKQVVAVGWDCPRAHILLKFRETRSAVFEIQTVGRIMRMPEFKHYKNEDLNRAYVYANLEKIEIDEEALEYLKTKKAVRKGIYRDLNLESVYLMRGEYNDLLLGYRRYFFLEFLSKIKGVLDEGKAKANFELLKKYKSADGTSINLDIRRLEEGLIVDKTIEEIDQESLNIVADKTVKAKIADDEIERYFVSFLKKNCGEFQPARSFDKIRMAIYQLFDRYLDSGNKDDRLYVQKVVLGNRAFFQGVITDSVKEYAKHRNRAEKIYKPIPKWNVPEQDFYSKNAEQREYPKSVMEPAYVLVKWKTEIGFIENYLEERKTIVWWYKNGDAKNEIYFGVPFVDEKGRNATFYPDFIVGYKDGRTGIFDTKEGQTATSEDTKLKAEALQRYIKDQNKKGKSLFGGIVIPDKEKENWRLSQDQKYNFDKNNWENL
jgi:type III restriction enzyme